ncbi:MAG: hypothetical protein F7B60_03530 [Desulfurococcales archaeon]|nr:hypothetical protein [Desulfurococcales archaeon]
MKYNVQTSNGGFVEIEEKNSVLITIGAIISGLTALILIIEGLLVFNQNTGTGLSFFIAGIVAGIYTAVLSHLKHKADMKPSEALISTVSGSSVRVWKDSSIWISILLAFIYLGILASLGLLGYGFYAYKVNPVASESFITMGILGLITGVIFARIFGFLRTKLEFKGEKVITVASSGDNIELYKDRSVWLTIGFIVTLLGGIAFIIIPILSLLGFMSFSPIPLLTKPGHIHSAAHDYLTGFREWTGILGLFIYGIVLLVNAAVLNFLRVRTQIRLYNKV